MSADKSAGWFRQKMAEHLAVPAGAEKINFRIDRLVEARRALTLIEQRLSGANAQLPLWGALVGDDLVPALRTALGGELAGHLAQLDAELSALLVALCGAAIETARDKLPAPSPPAPHSLWQRVKNAFGASSAVAAGRAPVGLTPSVATVGVDLQRARDLSRRLPGALWLQLLSHGAPSVRRVLLDAPPLDESVRLGLEARLEKTRDDELSTTLVTALGAMASARYLTMSFDSEALLRAVLWRAKNPRLRAATITALVQSKPTAAKEFSSGEIADRLAMVEGRRDDPTVIECLSDASPEVVAAAVEAVRAQTAFPRGRARDPSVLLRALLQLLDTAGPQAQLAALTLLGPQVEARTDVLFAPILRAATTGQGPVREQADALVAQFAQLKGLSRSQLSQLGTALPKLLPGSPGATAVAARVESGRGRVRSAEPKTELEAELEHGVDEKNWLVYADALTAAGDLRGELVVLASQGKDTRSYVEKHADALLGELPAVLEQDLSAFLDGLKWRNGFIESATLKVGYDRRDEVMERLVGALLSAPAARFLAELKVGLVSHGAEENDYQEVVATLGQSPHANLLRRLVLGEFEYPDELQISWAPWGDISSVWTVLPGLEALHLRGSGGSLGAIRSAALRSLTIETGGLGRAQFEAVLAMDAPKLERLELWFGDENYGATCTGADGERLLASKGLKLKTLGLVNASFVHELIPALAASTLLKGLEELDLSRGALQDGDVDLLVRHAPAFAHLKRINVVENLFDERQAELQRAWPNATFGEQRYWEDYGADEPGRYVAVGE